MPTLLLLLLAALADPPIVPVGREPRHHVIYQNDHVRVIDARIPAEWTTLYHTHARDNVAVCIAGGPMTTQPLGGIVSPGVARAGAVSFAAAPYTHQLANPGTTALHFVDVEIAARGTPAPTVVPTEAPAGHTVEIDNARVRVLRVPAVAGVGRHVHERALLEVVLASADGATAAEPGVLPRPGGTIAWHDARTAIEGPRSSDAIEIELK
jgi:hypothetical protein